MYVRVEFKESSFLFLFFGANYVDPEQLEKIYCNSIYENGSAQYFINTLSIYHPFKRSEWFAEDYLENWVPF